MSRDPHLALAQNVRAFRTARGWTVRDLAGRAGVSVKTVVNVENGRGCSPRTEESLAAVFDTVANRLRHLDPTAEAIRIVQADEGRWFFRDPEEAAAYAQRTRAGACATERRADPDAIQDPGERFRLGRNGLASIFLQIKSGRLTTGRHMVCLTEVFGRFVQPADPRRSTFLLHVLQGRVALELGDERATLAPGDLSVFAEVSAVSIFPAGPIAAPEDVPRVLVTRLGVEP